jgi:Gluconate 2-dehydrogenase subunit 3
MKRRSFFRIVAASSLAPSAAQTKRAAEAAASASAPPPVALESTCADAASEPQASFFTPVQFASLRRLCELIMPAAGSTPGAVEAEAPAFLDFLIAASPVEAQQLYREGLDRLEQRARERFASSFGALKSVDAETLLAPLRERWTYEPPADPVARFLRQAKQDIRTATMNSRGYVAQAAKRRRSGAGIGQYWHPLD